MINSNLDNYHVDCHHGGGVDIRKMLPKRHDPWNEESLQEVTLLWFDALLIE